MDHHLLAGGCEITRFSVEHSQEIVDPLTVGVQQLAREADGVVEMQLLQVVDMHLQSKGRTFLGLEVFRRNAHLAHELIHTVIKSENVIGHVHVPVVVNPFGQHTLVAEVQLCFGEFLGHEGSCRVRRVRRDCSMPLST